MLINGIGYDLLVGPSVAAWEGVDFKKEVRGNVEDPQNVTVETSIAGFIDAFRAGHNNTNVTCYSEKYQGRVEMEIVFPNGNTNNSTDDNTDDSTDDNTDDSTGK